MVVFILLLGLNLSIPNLNERPEIEFKEPPKKFLQFVEYKEPPTKGQYILFWGLNTLDIYTTYRALKQPNVIENNPFLGNSPSLEELILFKSIGGSLVGNNIDRQRMKVANGVLAYVVYRNYKIQKEVEKNATDRK
jgi:hypothetical protein